MDIGFKILNKIIGRPGDLPIWEPVIPGLIPPVQMSARERAQEARNLKLLEPSTAEFAKAILIWCRANGIRAILGETYRSSEDQDQISRSKTAIPEGKIGWHQVGRAFHLILKTPKGQIDKDAYPRVGDEVERRGGVWLGRTPLKTPGGMVVDLAHFEYHPGLALSSYRGSALAAKELAKAEKRAAKYA